MDYHNMFLGYGINGDMHVLLTKTHVLTNDMKSQLEIVLETDGDITNVCASCDKYFADNANNIIIKRLLITNYGHSTCAGELYVLLANLQIEELHILNSKCLSNKVNGIIADKMIIHIGETDTCTHDMPVDIINTHPVSTFVVMSDRNEGIWCDLPASQLCIGCVCKVLYHSNPNVMHVYINNLGGRVLVSSLSPRTMLNINSKMTLVGLCSKRVEVFC